MWCAIPRKRFGDLACRPFGLRMGRDIEVNGVTPMMGQDYKHKQQAKAHCPYYQQICRRLLNVVLEKGTPTLRRWLSLTHHVLRYGRLRDLNTQLQQLAMNPWG